MSDFPFDLIRVRDPALSAQLKAKIAENIGPRESFARGPGFRRLPGVRAPLGAPPPLPLPRPRPRAEDPVTPEVDEGFPPPPPSSQLVRSNHYAASVLLFNFMGTTAGGGGNNEIRVSPWLEFESLETKAIMITPYSGVQAGQFLQILKSGDNDIANTATPTGTPVGTNLGRRGDYPAPDNSVGIPVPLEPTLFDTFRVGWADGCYLKLRLFFVAPAISLPVISVQISITYRRGPGAYLFAVRS